MKTTLFDYQLPDGHIANSSVSPRDHSKLMVIDRNNGEIIHKHFYDIINYLTENDVLVLNDTKVFPARVFGQKETGGKVEILLNKSLNKLTWEALCKPGIKIGTKVIFGEFYAEVIHRNSEIHILKFNINKVELLEKLQKVGITPLPPYIHNSEKESSIRKKYQTTYAKDVGSVAAPTAGFHFTKELLKKIKNKDIRIEYVTLHVGLGTFMPIKTDRLEDHVMHSEEFFIEPETLKRLKKYKKENKRIISVGTTATRVLESIAVGNTNGSTDIFLKPPYKFKFVDALITNFHLPKSTLLALVSAFVSFPNTKHRFIDFKNTVVGKAYMEAIKNNYRFYSFGDSMMISG
ncbi:MAG: tRNA preQ1(34) S-adenosylmethionine ribosyltransferase-isomerase QueA [Microgenomates group bacterium]